MADLENGLWAGSEKENLFNPTISFDFVTAMVKGKTHGFSLKAGDAQNGDLETVFAGGRPKGYDPMKKQGAIILGIGGDNSDSAIGTFFEGAMTAGWASDITDQAVHANIRQAGYGT
jgi:non-reducing end alpha-L-arabinofuranosidase